MTKKEALAKDLEIVEEDLEETGPDTFEDTNTCYEYWVLTDDEADEEFYKQTRNIIEDLRYDALTDKSYIIRNIESDVFYDMMVESNQEFIDSFNDEELIYEALSFGSISEEEATELSETLNEDELENVRNQLLEDLNNSLDPIEWYTDNYGEFSLINDAFEYHAINFRELVSDIQEVDGRDSLASWDGIERYINGTDYYYYRIN